MKKNIISLGCVMVFLSYFFVFNASATYIDSTEGNDKDNPSNVLPIISSDPNYDDYDFEEYPLSFFTKLDSQDYDFENTQIGDVFGSEDFYITVTDIKGTEAIGGTWTSTSPVDFVVIKAGNGFSVYSVDQTTDGVWSGDWSTAELAYEKKNKPGQWITPGLSHFSGYYGGNPPSGGGAQVPEPATVILLGSGLLGLFGFRFRKKFWKPKK